MARKGSTRDKGRPACPVRVVGNCRHHTHTVVVMVVVVMVVVVMVAAVAAAIILSKRC